MVLPAETLKLQLDPLRARAVANRFILENLADRFSAGEPRVLAFPGVLLPACGCSIFDLRKRKLRG